MNSPRSLLALVATTSVAFLAAVSCATLAGLDQDYVAGSVGGAGPTTSVTTSTADTGGSTGLGGAGGPSTGGAGLGGAGVGGSAGSGGETGGGGAGGTAPLSYAALVRSDGPVGYWRFGEQHGPTANDSSGHNHHAVYNGTIDYAVAGAIHGDLDTAIHFTGAGADVSHPLDFDDFDATEPYSLEAWFKADAYDGTYRHLFNKDHTGLNGRHNIGLFVTTNENLGFERIIADQKLQAVGPLPALGVWTYIVGTYDGGALRLYVDGQLIQTTLDNRLQDPKPVPSFIGAKFPVGNVLMGALDEFAIYDVALPAARIAAHYQAGRGP